MSLTDWAIRWNIPHAALDDLARTLGAQTVPQQDGVSETAVQQRVRLKASRNGARLFRNNVGVLRDERGVPVRYGLANDSKQMNENMKSSDLIGITPVVITPAHIGHTVGAFTSYEIKRQDWKYRGDKRETAQLAWLTLVNKLGGIGRFLTSEEDL